MTSDDERGCPYCGSEPVRRNSTPPGNYRCNGCGALLCTVPEFDGEWITLKRPDAMPPRVSGVPQ